MFLSYLKTLMPFRFFLRIFLALHPLKIFLFNTLIKSLLFFNDFIICFETNRIIFLGPEILTKQVLPLTFSSILLINVSINSLFINFNFFFEIFILIRPPETRIIV